MKDPIKHLICHALEYYTEKCPDWEDSQPDYFKARVVESWKDSIKSYIANGRVVWQLTLSGEVFKIQAPLFQLLDWSFNPYLESFNKPVLYLE